MNVITSLVSTLLQFVGMVLFKYYGWVVIVLILAYAIWQNRRKTEWAQNHESVLLLIEVPKDNEKKELSAEQMFASLHGILKPQAELNKEGALQEHISFEIASLKNQIRFFVWTPKHLKDFVEGQIYAQYPTVHIKELEEDYAFADPGERVIYGSELTLTKEEFLPIKTFVSFEVDPLAGITAVLSKMDQAGEEMWIQVLARPIDDSWQDRGLSYIDVVKGGKGNTTAGKKLTELPVFIAKNIVPALWSPPYSQTEGKKSELSTGQSAVIKAIEEKTAKLGYHVKIRIAYMGPEQALARQRMQAIVGAFKQYNTTNLNGFAVKSYGSTSGFLQEYRSRLFTNTGYTLNIEELASLYHLPHTSVETPNMVWTTTKTAEPPSNLPVEGVAEPADVSLFGLTNFRGGDLKFGIKRADRGRHLYIVGQTGTGKSSLLELLTMSDIYQNQGFAVVDPHGDYAVNIMRHIPPERIKDVVYFNPADRAYPIAFNPLEMIDPDSKNHLTSELVGVLKKMFESWGPRLEHILRFTILALLDYPDATLLGITEMLTNKNFRKKVVAEIKDPVVKGFWVNEFASWNDKFANEAVAPVLNKVGAFIANPLVRNIIGQTRSTINVREIMDEGKILIVNLSRGLIGEDNSAILGALMVTKIQLAAMSRANVPMEERKPFYLYVDEFQNFATESFAVILSEARKYGLNLTVANQYIEQMEDTVKDAVFGNVGSMISFRVGATDATSLSKYYEPIFEPGDLIKLHNYHVFVVMSIDGERSTPFSGVTLKMPLPADDGSQAIIDHSRATYATERGEVEEIIRNWNKNAGGVESGEQNPNGILGQLKSQNRVDAEQSLVDSIEQAKVSGAEIEKPAKPMETTSSTAKAASEQGALEPGSVVRFD